MMEFCGTFLRESHIWSYYISLSDCWKNAYNQTTIRQNFNLFSSFQQSWYISTIQVAHSPYMRFKCVINNQCVAVEYMSLFCICYHVCTVWLSHSYQGSERAELYFFTPLEKNDWRKTASHEISVLPVNRRVVVRHASFIWHNEVITKSRTSTGIQTFSWKAWVF